MKERPILFSGPMVRALLEGRKTQTRRVAKVFRPDPDATDPRDYVLWHAGKVGIAVPAKDDHERCDLASACPYGEPGDRLWVRETWRPRVLHSCAMDGCDCESVAIRYEADEAERAFYESDRKIPDEWTMPMQAKRGNVPGIHMPRWMSRITLEVTSVRVERVADISDPDAEAEGIEPSPNGHPAHIRFAELWDSINGKRPGCSWDANPWVWAVGFKVVL